MAETSNERGKRFEGEIEALLLALRSGREEYVEVTPQAKIKLYGDVPQKMRPDFELRIHWPHETAVYLIEARDRKRSSPDIAAKIDRLKKLSKHNSFIYLYKDRLEELTRNALEQDGVMIMSQVEFVGYLDRIAEGIDDLAISRKRRLGGGYRESETGPRFMHYRSEPNPKKMNRHQCFRWPEMALLEGLFRLSIAFISITGLAKLLELLIEWIRR